MKGRHRAVFVEALSGQGVQMSVDRIGEKTDEHASMSRGLLQSESGR